MADKAKLLVLYHSSYGHTETLAYAMAHGVRAVEDIRVTVKRVPELMPDDVMAAAGMKVEQPAPVAEPAELAEYDGIILGTPEYHGSMSGVLKNMLDLMSADQFEGKVVGLLGVAGGHPGAISSLNTMRMIGRNLHCWVLPQEVSIANSSQTFNDDGTVKDPEIEERLLNVGRQLVKFASVQQRVQQDEFMKMWKSLPTW